MWLLWKSKLIEIAVVFAVLGGAYWWVYNQGVSHERKKSTAEQVVANNEAQAKYNLVAEQYETLKGKREKSAEVITKVVQKIVTRDVYHNVCIDNSGLQLANEALSGSTDSSKLDAAVQTVTSP